MGDIKKWDIFWDIRLKNETNGRHFLIYIKKWNKK